MHTHDAVHKVLVVACIQYNAMWRSLHGAGQLTVALNQLVQSLASGFTAFDASS